MSHGSHNTTVPFNGKASTGGKQRSKLVKPNRAARRDKGWKFDLMEE